MTEISLYDLYILLKSDNIGLSYQGSFNDEITGLIISLSETNLDNVESAGKIRNRVSFLLAESFQNIVKHAESPALGRRASNSRGMFFTRHLGGNHVVITSANLVENKNVDHLRDSLNNLNDLDAEELKQLYRDVISTGEFSAKGGAGLGMIEMARKSKSKLMFDFVEINDILSVYYLQIELNGTGENKDAFGLAKKMHSVMTKNSILMNYKGDFSQETMLPVLRMMEDNMAHQFEEYTTKKRVYLTLVEVLQNLCQHSIRIDGFNEGIFTMGKFQHYYTISTGNIVAKSDYEPLLANLDKLSAMSKEQLREHFTQTLKSTVLEQDAHVGLGLIDIFRNASLPVKYEFISVDDDHYFFTFTIVV